MIFESNLSPSAEFWKRAVRYLRGNNLRQIDYARVLYRVVFERQPSRVLEIGTARGFSTACMAQALVDSGNNGGMVISIDTVSHDEPRYWHSAKNAKADPLRDRRLSRRTIWAEFDPEHVLSSRITFAIRQEFESRNVMPRSGFEVAFVDGDHSFVGVSKDIELIREVLAPGAVVVFDDYTVSRPLSFEFRSLILSVQRSAGVKRAVDRLLRTGGFTLWHPRRSNFDRIAIVVKD